MAPSTLADETLSLDRETEVLTRPPHGKRQVVMLAKDAPSAKGRRAYFTYSELGVTKATDGRMRAQVVATDRGMTQPTGWHYHHCDSQFLYTLQGWIDLAFEDGTRVRVSEGDTVLIPGGVIHNEMATSDDFQVLEVSVPAEMGTAICDPPPGFDR